MSDYDKFYELLKDFDRNFQMSDDNSSYTKGESQLKQLRMVAHELEMPPEDFHDKTGQRL